jgi:nucleoside-diphosphate kinase
MFDIKNARPFLKRQQIPEVKLDDFYQGAQVTVLARVLNVTDYGDVQTRNHFENQRQRTFALVKPDCYMNMGKIMNDIYGAGFKINRLKMSKFNNSTASKFYEEHVNKEFFPNLSGHMMSDVSIGLELVANDAVSKWRSVIGPTNTQNAQ